MLLFAFALASATIGPAPEPQRVRRTKVVRVRRAKAVRVPARAKPNAVRIPIVAPPRDPSQRYRLTGMTSDHVDGKDLAVRDKGMPCGTTGAPVCPSNGTKLLKAPIDD